MEAASGFLAARNGTVDLNGHPMGLELGLEKNFGEGLSQSFFMILATEMGDETFIIAAVMAMRHPKITVLGGALAALYFMTVLSAGLGLVLPNLISQQTVHSCATILYTFFGCRLMWIGARGEVEDKDEEADRVAAEAADARDAKEEAITKASIAEVMEWNPATGQMEATEVDLDVLRAEALAALGMD